LYAYSSRVYRLNGGLWLPFAANHSISYTPTPPASSTHHQQQQQPYLVQLLRTFEPRVIDVDHSLLAYQISATIDRGQHCLFLTCT